ncbi:uncharacterized protein BJ171DRAFT_221569 [Polychytrium aggregatum]|uniref:uncharacterized protein n=1 Tax=Polychytrium aggregatum TaxID=110093 RepID=UPI0022FEC605|nr:uncharacterized protein BJ171DRAFT_221569 [Polychytrium aggregatum]KAI9197492.1 hypothetical protein BJ171DRAFT_221569 [Polychytrium aggregatum]
MSWLFLVATVVGPYLYRKYQEYRSPGKIQRPPKPRTQYDTYASALILGALALWIIFSATSISNNIFATLEAAPNVPQSILRRSFFRYMAQTFPGWTEDYLAQEIAAGSTASGLESIARLERLLELLASIENRAIYLKFGELALLDCSWCTSPPDYMIFSLAPMLAEYAMALIIVGLSTSTARKAFWRIYGTVVIVALALFEIYAFRLFPDSIIITPSPFIFGETIRRAGVALVLLAIWLIDRKNEWSSIEIMAETIAKQQAVYKHFFVVRLAQAALLSETNLRRRFMEHHKEKEIANEAIYRDESFQQTREEALRHINVDQMAQDASNFTSDVFETALREGLLSSIETTLPSDAALESHPTAEHESHLAAEQSPAGVGPNVGQGARRRARGGR